MNTDVERIKFKAVLNYVIFHNPYITRNHTKDGKKGALRLYSDIEQVFLDFGWRPPEPSRGGEGKPQ